jgi:hypothetical protein
MVASRIKGAGYTRFQAPRAHAAAKEAEERLKQESLH